MPRDPLVTSQRLRPGVAAHHAVTADAAREVLLDGGTAADAAVAGVLASGVAESLLTTLLGGGHGIYYDATAGDVTLIDFFVTIPGLARAVPAGTSILDGIGRTVDIVFESEPIPYEIGCDTAGVPGVPAGCGVLWERWGRMPWARLVEPAVAAARRDVTLLPTHEVVLKMMSPAYTLDRGADMFAPGGELLKAGERLHQPRMEHFLRILAEEGPRSVYDGQLAKDLLALCRDRGGLIDREDLAAYEVLIGRPASVSYAGAQVFSRRGMSALLPTLGGLPDFGALDPAARALALAAAFQGGTEPGETTNLAVVDQAGNACVVTTSIGIGTGDWLHDVHLNSMLGEGYLRPPNPQPGDRMGSMMSPTVAMAPDGPVLAVGAAGGSRITGALTQVIAGVLAEQRSVADAIERPRMHRVGQAVMVEPDFEDEGAAALAAAGYEVRRFGTRHHFFGGVSGIGRATLAADSRRDGASRLV
ncbi:MAG: gamma-glutamyltranspeptidase [Nitriliruptorales bacterium]|nr:gamma-glutamyltranspeptidase [Nitriliruptorales bacterium]